MRISQAPVYRRRRRVAAAILTVIVAGSAGFGSAALVSHLTDEPDQALAAVRRTPEPTATPLPAATASAPAASPVPVASATSAFDLTARSLSDPDSLWVVVNKRRPLEPVDYRPSDLETIPGMPSGATMRAEAARALGELHAAAVAAGAPFTVSTAFREYSLQRELYEGYVDGQGTAAADRFSARPGFSEHQTGLAADINNGTCDLQACFGETAPGQFVADHAWEYGFVIRYPENRQDITGYIYEPWHLRYVGRELAAELRLTGAPTLEEFFGLEAAGDYS